MDHSHLKILTKAKINETNKEVAGKMSKKHNDLKNCMLHDKSDKRERKPIEHNYLREKHFGKLLLILVLCSSGSNFY